MTSPSIPKPPSRPQRASPLSFRTMRPYLSAGCGGGGITVSPSRSSTGRIRPRPPRLLFRLGARNGGHAERQLADELLRAMRSRDEGRHSQFALRERRPRARARARSSACVRILVLVFYIEVEPHAKPRRVDPGLVVRRVAQAARELEPRLGIAPREDGLHEHVDAVELGLAVVDLGHGPKVAHALREACRTVAPSQ